MTPLLLALALHAACPAPDATEAPCQAQPGLDTAHVLACEVCVLRGRLADTREDLLTALQGRAAERAGAEDLARRLARAVQERDEARQGARGRATAAWALGVAGTVLEAGAVAVLLAGGSTTIAAGLAGVGAAGAAAGVTVAVW